MTINTLHSVTVDGVTLSVTRWDGDEQLRLAVVPVGKPSAMIPLTLAQFVELGRKAFEAAGIALPEAQEVASAAQPDYAAESAARHLEYGRRQQAEFNRRSREGTRHASR